MSRIGNKAIALPAGVTVTVNEGNNVTVKGAKGELSAKFHSALTIEVSATEVLVKRPDDSKENKMFHGTTRALLHNMIVGVSEGFTKTIADFYAQQRSKQVVVPHRRTVTLQFPDGLMAYACDIAKRVHETLSVCFFFHYIQNT